jgi:hypothetical protein
VYQLATADDPKHAEVDANNDYYWRFNRQRLDAESIRDALLQVSGGLDPKIGGKSLSLDDEKNDRRTLYGEVSRFQANEYLQTFDFPNPSLSAERRFATNVPLQSLYFMNSDFVRRQANRLVGRLVAATEEDDAAAVEDGESEDDSSPESSKDDAPQESDSDEDESDSEETDLPKHFDDRAMIEAAYPLLYGREVTEQEISLGLEFLVDQRASLLAKELKELEEKKAEDAEAAEEAEDDDPTAEEDDDPAVLAERRASMQAWVQYARALFSAAEFRFID